MPKKQTKVEENLAAQEETISLEEAFKALDSIVERMQSKDIPLEEAVAQYQKGMKLCAQCAEQIDLAEKKVIQLSGEEETLEF